MSKRPEGFYSEERWDNWLERVREEDLDPENEESARILLNLQDDAAIAVAKILTAFEDDTLDEEEALDEIADIRDVVLGEVQFDDEEKAMLVEGVQVSLVAVFVAAEEYIVGGPAEEAPLEEYVRAAADAERDDDPDAALGYCAQAGTRIVAGDDLDMTVAEDLEYGRVAEWVNGLDSLQRALEDPEVVEDDEGE
ncbi:MAG: DUF2150 family protein [Halobacteriales archaeon]